MGFPGFFEEARFLGVLERAERVGRRNRRSHTHPQPAVEPGAILTRSSRTRPNLFIYPPQCILLDFNGIFRYEDRVFDTLLPNDFARSASWLSKTSLLLKIGEDGDPWRSVESKEFWTAPVSGLAWRENKPVKSSLTATFRGHGPT